MSLRRLRAFFARQAEKDAEKSVLVLSGATCYDLTSLSSARASLASMLVRIAFQRLLPLLFACACFFHLTRQSKKQVLNGDTLPPTEP